MGLFGSILSQKTRVQFITSPPNITVIQFDASIKENHNRESPPTEFPIENGQTVSDHVIVKPFSLELTGIISDTPIGGVQGLLTELATTVTSALTPPIGVVAASAGYSLFKALSNSTSPSVAAYGQLLQLQANAQPFDVLTSLYRYQNMWIKSLSAPRDADTGKVLIFTVSLVQLLLVEPVAVSIQVFASPYVSANKADLGSQGTQIVNATKQGVAAAYATAGHIVGISQ